MSFTAPSPTKRINSQRHYAETFYTEFRLNRSSTEIIGKVNLHLSEKSVTASIFTQLMPYRHVLVRYSVIFQSPHNSRCKLTSNITQIYSAIGLLITFKQDLNAALRTEWWMATEPSGNGNWKRFSLSLDFTDNQLQELGDQEMCQRIRKQQNGCNRIKGKTEKLRERFACRIQKLFNRKLSLGLLSEYSS